MRIGNAAYGHLQLDIYGELMDSLYLYDKYGAPLSYDMWTTVERLLDWVAKNWEQPDQSIWEVRGRGGTSRTRSCSAGWRSIAACGWRASGPSRREGDTWRHERNRIYQRHHARRAGTSASRAFTQFFGSDAVDAATLMMPLMLFVSPHDPRMLATLARIRKELAADSLVRRYQIGKAANDGLPGSGRLLHRVLVLAGGGDGARRTAWRRRNCCSRSCWVTPTISACSRKRSARRANCSAISRRR